MTVAPVLTDDEVDDRIRVGLDAVDLDGRTVCILVPDATRTCPLPRLLASVHRAIGHRVRTATVVVALGTHAPLGPTRRRALVGAGTGDWAVVDHEWWDDATFATLGRIGADRVGDLSGGRLHHGVDVRVNRAVVDHDVTLIVGPVLPHEVVGFSGGNKYLFPGVGGPEMIDLSHWLGALITSADIIGTTGITPVRALIDEASAMVPSTRVAVCVVTSTSGDGSGDDRLHAVEVGAPEDAWARAAEVASRTHVRLLDRPVSRVLSLVPARYEDLWTGAKAFYKVEPVVADGGQVVIHAPHLTDISTVHPEVEQVGYHCRDYFVGQWDRFAHLPWGGARPRHPPARGGHLGRRRRGAVPGAGHAGDRHRRGAGAGRGPGPPRPPRGRRGGVGGRARHAGGARRG